MIENPIEITRSPYKFTNRTALYPLYMSLCTGEPNAI